ncbi:MAG: glycosyltransferase family 4 protein [bacterium]|nr:glycosyltransferase family 4 protein [bacterium]
MSNKISKEPAQYYIFIGRLNILVRKVNIIIQLFNQLQIPLLIMGSGPDEKFLKSIAHDNILFL